MESEDPEMLPELCEEDSKNMVESLGFGGD